jgi:hypothetical protein
VHRALGTLLVIALSFPALAAQRDSDPHISAESGNNVYAASAFAHGLRHGYEEGFHAADRDLQLSAFSLDDIAVPRSSKKVIGYRSEFGPKESFHKGFAQGYRLGFADSVKGIAFRMTPPEVTVAAKPDGDFDRGVQYGYLSPGTACSGSPTFCSGVQAGRSIALKSVAATQVASVK